MTARQNSPKDRDSLESGINLTATQRGHQMGLWSDRGGAMRGRTSTCSACGMSAYYYYDEMKAVGSAVYGGGCKQQG